jgi:glycosyltransferase involved in cell wall biosynthesis
VEFLSGLSASECHELSKAALFSVVPLKDGDTAAGQVTVVEAMRLGRAVVATRAPGTVDYIRDSETGLLVEPNSPSELADAMTKLWNDAALRGRLVSNAAFFADEILSDEAAAEALLDIMRKVERD